MDYEADEAGRDCLALDYDRRWIGGVCAGCANYFDIDPAFVRVGTVVTGLFFPQGRYRHLPDRLARSGPAQTPPRQHGIVR